jgi:hypothetical protein
MTGFDKLDELACAGNTRRNTATLNKSLARLRRTLPQKIALDFSSHRAMHGGRIQLVVATALKRLR